MRGLPVATVCVLLALAPDARADDDLPDGDDAEPAIDPGPAAPAVPQELPAKPKDGLAPPRADPYLPREPAISPSGVWLLTQLVPSPSLVVGSEGARLGLGWQITPLLYSFGIHRRMWPLRVLVAEPVVRHSGSVELFASPQWVAYRGGTALLDAGVRATLPLLHRGEYLSVSLGVAHTRLDDRSAVRYEAGAHVLFGTVGLVVGVSPSPALAPLSTSVTLRLRYF